MEKKNKSTIIRLMLKLGADPNLLKGNIGPILENQIKKMNK